MTDSEIITQVIELREDLAKAEERAKIYQELYEREVDENSAKSKIIASPWRTPIVTCKDTFYGPGLVPDTFPHKPEECVG